MLSRHDILEIMGMTVPAYDALANRGLLPFRIKGGTVSRFTEVHLLKMGLFRSLAAAGATQAVAAQVVSNGFDDFDIFAAVSKPSPGSSFAFGAAGMQAGEDVDWLPVFGLWRPGKPVVLGTTRGKSLEPGPPVQMVLIDATKVVGGIFASARKVGRSGQELEKWAAHFRAKVR
jgi:hypothetical protein